MDPARAPPRHGVVVQVGPGLQQKRHTPPGDWEADLESTDRLDNQCQAVFLGHASRSTQNALVPAKFIPNAFWNGNVAIGVAGPLGVAGFASGAEVPPLADTARRRVGRQPAVCLSVTEVLRLCHRRVAGAGNVLVD